VPVQHIQTYLVHPGKGAAAVQPVNGTSLSLTGSMFDLLDGIYSHLRVAPSGRAVTPQTIMGWRMGGSAHQKSHLEVKS
jgi:hypothetical protein